MYSIVLCFVLTLLVVYFFAYKGRKSFTDLSTRTDKFLLFSVLTGFGLIIGFIPTLFVTLVVSTAGNLQREEITYVTTVELQPLMDNEQPTQFYVSSCNGFAFINMSDSNWQHFRTETWPGEETLNIIEEDRTTAVVTTFEDKLVCPQNLSKFFLCVTDLTKTSYEIRIPFGAHNTCLSDQNQ